MSRQVSARWLTPRISNSVLGMGAPRARSCGIVPECEGLVEHHVASAASADDRRTKYQFCRTIGSLQAAAAGLSSPATKKTCPSREACMADGTQQIEAGWDANAIRALFDPKTGWLDRRVHSDAALYQLELERVFARGWNFMCHESQLPNAGDYFINYIGEDQVICVRDEEGAINVLLNTCRHRGNALCRAEQGRAKSFEI